LLQEIGCTWDDFKDMAFNVLGDMSLEERGLFMEEKALRLPRRKLWGREGVCHEIYPQNHWRSIP